MRSLDMVSDGVFDMAGQWFVLWPVGIVADLQLLDAVRLPTSYIAVAEDRTGDVFCIEAGQQGETCSHPIDGSMQRLAPDIVAFWRGWTDRSITT